MMTSILLPLLILNYISIIINDIYYYQSDNYHYRIFKHLLKKDLISRIYNYFLLIFVPFTNNLVIQLILICYCLISMILNTKEKNYKKIKKTKRIKRLSFIYITFILISLFSKYRIPLLLLITIIHLILSLLIFIISSFVEQLLMKRYYIKAKKKVNKYKPIIIAITGSCGKTSVKNYIYTSMKNEYMVYKSPKSYNTLKGLSITINEYLNHYNSIFILEMGLSHKNDIKKITKYFKPNISIITEILPSHLETMKSINNIIDEKMQIIKNMQSNGLIIINNDNEQIKNNIDKYNINNNKIVKIGINKENDIYATNIEIKKDGLALNIIDQKKNIKIQNSLLGKHNIYNLLITYAVLNQFDISHEKLNDLQSYENRLEIKKYNQMTILNDSYNSNINGFKNALDVLSLYETPKYIITPGIVELGRISKDTIYEIGDKIVKICDFCYLIDNKNTQFFIEKFNEKKYKNFKVKKTFLDAFNEVKNMEITLLIENDLTDFYFIK